MDKRVVEYSRVLAESLRLHGVPERRVRDIVAQVQGHVRSRVRTRWRCLARRTSTPACGDPAGTTGPHASSARSPEP